MNKDPDPRERLAARALRVQSGPQGAPRPQLRQDLLDRVNASARAHAEYCTVRRDATPWVEVGDGARISSLEAIIQRELAWAATQDVRVTPDRTLRAEAEEMFRRFVKEGVR